MASPLEIYTRRNSALDAKYFQQLAKEERIVLWVVGLPVHLDGRESQKSQEARRFGKWLTEITALPVEFFDERFTSVQAEELLQAAELTSKRKKKDRHARRADHAHGISGFAEQGRAARGNRLIQIWSAAARRRFSKRATFGRSGRRPY